MKLKTKIGKKQKYHKAIELLEYWFISFQLTCFFKLYWNDYKIIKARFEFIFER